jgi:hypothetical protein
MGAIGGLPDAGAEPVVLGVGVPHVRVAHRRRLLPPLSFPAAAREVERERERDWGRRRRAVAERYIAGWEVRNPSRGRAGLRWADNAVHAGPD